MFEFGNDRADFLLNEALYPEFWGFLFNQQTRYLIYLLLNNSQRILILGLNRKHRLKKKIGEHGSVTSKMNEKILEKKRPEID